MNFEPAAREGAPLLTEGLISGYSMPGCIQSGTGFPDGRCFGKCVPESALRVVPTFRLRALAESATRNLLLKWDALSQQALKRKLRPSHSEGRFRDTLSEYKEGHLMWPSTYICCGCFHDKPRFNTEALMCSPCEQDCPSREPYVPRRRADEPVKTCRYLILVVPGARLGSVSLASVWKCSVYTFLPSRNIS